MKYTSFELVFFAFCFSRSADSNVPWTIRVSWTLHALLRIGVGHFQQTGDAI